MLKQPNHMMAQHSSFALKQICNGQKVPNESIYQRRPTPPSHIGHLMTPQKFLPLAAILSIEMEKRINNEILALNLNCLEFELS